MPLSPEEREHYRSYYNHVPVVVIQGELIELSYVTSRKGLRFPGRRSSIKGFTRSARLRMLRTIACVDWSQVGRSLFITLTYPNSRARRGVSERTRDRYLFHRAMENYLGKKVGALWRVEWKKRKSGRLKGMTAPHVHLIVFGVPFIPWQEIRKWWRDALHVDGALSTDVRRIEGGRKVAVYVAKYCSKLPENLSLDYESYLNNTGRHWGVLRRDLIPWCDRHVMRIADQVHIKLLENAACMTFPYFTRGARQGFSLFGKNAEKVIARILRTDIDERLGLM